jgi:poly(3-hydroxybutyrate) depolymerase
MSRPLTASRAMAALTFAASAFAAQAAAPLPALVIDGARTTVSGLSSGAYMAVQMHVAYSATFHTGAGIVAGGPYYCAQDSLATATGPCMAHSSSIPVASLVATTNSWAAAGSIDPVANLAGSKVYLYSGTQDQTVVQAVMNDLRTYYASFVPAANIVYKNTLGSGHAMITDDFGGACSGTATPFVNDCNFDLAGALLQQLYGPLNARNAGALSGNFVQFDQTAFVSGHGMASTGWLYVPAACAAGESCRLHVAFHGCLQNSGDVGEQYVRDTGYNRWADTNHIVVLYPQTGAATSANPNGCWDWWGYDSANYAKKSGPQMAAVKAMVDRLASGTPPPAPANIAAPTGVTTSGATGSSVKLAWGAVAGATGYDVWRGPTKVNATPLAATSLTDTGLASATLYH